MARRLVLPLVLSLLTLPFLGGVDATHPCEFGRIVFYIPTVAYVVYDEQQAVITPVVDEILIYAESNEEDGLQRGGESLLFDYQDHCVESENPDTLIF